jgi:molecular chaperone DnaK
LAEVSGKLAERVYAQTSQEAGAGQGAAGAEEATTASSSSDDVVDAEFEEVKEDDKK